MRTIIRDNAEELWLRGIELLKSGHMVAPRNMTTTERPLTFVLTDLNKNLVTNPYRKVNYAFAVAEVIWIWKGYDDVEFIKPYNKAITKFSDDGKSFYGAYGPPFREQLYYVLDKLRTDTHSRQAVITIWRQNPEASKDIPCTVMMHFMIRDGKLNLIVYMRSNDFWLGFPYDIHTFTTIQKQIAEMLGVGYGTYTHIDGSAHLYSDDWVHCEWALKFPGSFGIALPEMKLNDLDELSNREFTIREHVGRVIPYEHPDSWLRLHCNLLLAYWKKKRRYKNVIFPEPYHTLREKSREVRTKIGGSSHSRKVRGDEGDTPKR